LESDACPNQAFCFGRHVLALQFHWEAHAESLAALISHCRHELVPARFVQDAAALWAGQASFGPCHRHLEATLDRLLRNACRNAP
jgi:hypothetical protein